MNDTDKGLPELQRIQHYLSERESMRGLDPDAIHTLNCGEEREAELRVSDLRALLALSAASGKAVAWRYLQPLSDTTYAWTRWLEMSDLYHYGVDGNLVAGPHPDWKVEYAYLHPATVTDEDVERACVVMSRIGEDTEWPADYDSADQAAIRHFMRAALSSFANKEMK